jgi:NADH-quinone oxidoreductase subunit J
VAIVAAIALTLRERKDSRHLDASVQVRARKADRLRVVSMPPERPSSAPGAQAQGDDA